MEYVGEVLRRSVAEDRIRFRSESRNYMLEVRENYANMVFHTYIDATHFGNESRFVNHSCDPNCIIQIVMFDLIVLTCYRYALQPFFLMLFLLPRVIFKKEKKFAFIMEEGTLFPLADVTAMHQIAKGTCRFHC